MWNIGILITTAAAFALTFTCCLGTPAGPDNSLPQNLAVPFNDLLPPILDADATITTTEVPTTTTLKTTKTTTLEPILKTKATKKQITTHSPPLLFKSTKKSYYQQQTEHIKELHLIDDDGLIPHNYSEQAEQLQHLHDIQDKEYHQQLVQQKLQNLQQEKSIKFQKQEKLQKATAPLNAAFNKVPQHIASQPKKALPSNVAKVQTKKFDEVQTTSNIIEQAKPARLQFSPRQQQQYTAAQIIVQQQPQQQQYQQQQYRQQHRFQAQLQPLNFDAFQQYLDFQHTTHRPPKAGLPTLTPFPRHLK